MPFYIPKLVETDLNRFISFWSERYKNRNEVLYENNIGHELNEDRIMQLYKWKSVRPPNPDQLISIRNSYITRLGTPFPNTIEEGINYFDTLEGGRIWNVFWLHCMNPSLFPIFDQHTYRAFRFLHNGTIDEIDKLNDNEYKEEYFINYIHFFNQIGNNENRIVDKALFQFGKYLKKGLFV